MNRPKVITFTSASADGRIAVSPDVLLLWGDERWQSIEGEGQGSAFPEIKSAFEPQATLEGSGSFVREKDEPTPLSPFEGNPESLYQDFLPEDVINRQDHRGWFTVVDGRGRVRGWIKDGAVFGEEHVGWHLLVFVARRTSPDYLAYLQSENIPYLVAGEEQVDLQLALEKLKGQLGVMRLLSTAGGKLNGALLRAGLVDEIHIEFLPAIIGGLETPSLFNGPVLEADEWPTRLELLSSQVRDGGRVWLRYRVIQE